jgi:hypothetical protein
LAYGDLLGGGRLMDASTISTVATDLLAGIVASFSQPNTPTVPARQIVTHGAPVVQPSVEELAVYVTGVRSTRPFPLPRVSAVKVSVLPAVEIMVELWRACWPVPSVNPANKALAEMSAYTAAALALAEDAATMFGYVADLATAGGLFPSLPTIDRSEYVALSSMVPLGPSAAMAGWRWPIAVYLAVP